jgi:predicted DNA-binding ribbon-helix-helix protein
VRVVFGCTAPPPASRSKITFWRVLEKIERDGLTVPQLCTKLYDELVEARGEVENFASFLRVCCGRYLALQLSGVIPTDPSIAIRSLNAERVLATEDKRS